MGPTNLPSLWNIQQVMATAPNDLFSPLAQRSVTFPNRVVVSPMCQYSYTDGISDDWQFVHLGSRAVGGAGTVFTEAAAVSPKAASRSAI